MIKKFQLKNGLQVLLSESHKSPVVSVQMWVRTGSADEGRGEEGISHFIEHLVFKGTEKYKVGEIAALIEASGGELNAYTSFDQTVFYVTVSNEFFTTGLDVIHQMMGAPTFDPKEIDNEREVVIEEIKRGQDSLGRQASQLLFKTAFKKSAYRVPVIGYDKNIRKMSAKKIQNYFHSRYTPSNMFLVVTGAVDSAAAKAEIEKIFGQMKKQPLKRARRPVEPPQKTPRIATQKTNFEQSIGYFSWKIPGAAHKDIPALDVMSLILGQGDSSRLTKRLRLDKPLVSSIGMGNYLPQQGGLSLLSFGFEKERYSEVLSAISEEIESFKSQGPSAEELEKAIINLESGEIYSMETVDGLARRIGSVEFQFRDLKAFDRYFKALRALTPQEIQRVAKKYLNKKTLSMAVTTKGEVGDIQKHCRTFIKRFDQKLAGSKRASSKKVRIKKLSISAGTKSTPKIELHKLPCGARVLIRPSKETGLISAKMAFLGGIREEPIEKSGLAELFGRIWMGGTSTLSEHELSLKTDAIAAGLQPVVGKNSIGLGLEGLSLFEKDGAELFFDVLLNPTLPQEVIDRERELQVQQIKHKKDNPTQTVFTNFLSKMFAGHPYSREMIGTIEGLGRVTRDDLVGYRARLFSKERCHFSICGNVDVDFWLNSINQHLSKAGKQAVALSAHELGPLGQKVRHFEAAEKEQAHVVLGYRSFTMHDKRKLHLQILQSILAGQGGRLFLELRDKESLAYSVSPTRLEGLEGGYFGAYIGCSPEKVQKAVAMMRVEFSKLCDQLVSQEELDRAQRYLIGRHDIELQRTGSVASSILYEDVYGLDYNEVFHFSDLVRSVSAQDLQDAARSVFAGPDVLAVVGPAVIEKQCVELE